MSTIKTNLNNNVEMLDDAEGKIVLLFKDSFGEIHEWDPDDLISCGTPIEEGGANEGDDMGFYGIGRIKS